MQADSPSEPLGKPQAIVKGWHKSEVIWILGGNVFRWQNKNFGGGKTEMLDIVSVGRNEYMERVLTRYEGRKLSGSIRG